jgi:hypothetical protein
MCLTAGSSEEVAGGVCHVAAAAGLRLGPSQPQMLREYVNDGRATSSDGRHLVGSGSLGQRLVQGAGK